MSVAGRTPIGSDVFDPTMVESIMSTGVTPAAGREFLQQILTLSLDRAESMLAQLYDADAKGEKPLVRKCAHQLISSLGNLGAVDVVRICRSIQDDPDPAAGVAALPAAYDTFRAALTKYITQ